MVQKLMDNKLDSIVDNLFLFFPLFYRKILKGAHTKTGTNPINMQFHVLAMLMNWELLQTSEIGRKLGISKPNMTALMDKLIEKGYAQRSPDARDRRIIRIAITEKGKRFVINRKGIVRKSIKNNLSVLRDEELDNLYVALETFHGIISKVGNGS